MATSFGQKQCLPCPSCPQLLSASAHQSTPCRQRPVRLSRLAARAQQGSSQVAAATAVVAKPAKSEKKQSNAGPAITPEVAEDLYRSAMLLYCEGSSSLNRHSYGSLRSQVRPELLRAQGHVPGSGVRGDVRTDVLSRQDVRCVSASRAASHAHLG